MMGKSVVWAVLFAGAAMLPACTKEKGEPCAAPVITEVKYLPEHPGAFDEVTVTAAIRSGHCPFQACVVYQVVRLGEEWGNTEESYRSTAPVYSEQAEEPFVFTATIPATGLTGRKVRFAVEAVAQHGAYTVSDPAEYVVSGPVEPGREASDGRN